MPLSPEVAKEALSKVKQAAWTGHQLVGLKELPPHLAETGRSLLGKKHDEDQDLEFNQRDAAWQKAAERLQAMPAEDRLKLFEKLFPKIAPHVESAWQLLKRQPFQVSHGRKPFRAPEDPALTLQARGNFLRMLLSATHGYEQDIRWFSQWAAHVAHNGPADSLGVLFAAVIDQGGEDGQFVFDTLCASARGEHEIGQFGRHVTRALLTASREEGWEFIEKMLLAAQREEGLRQVIVESVDEAHPRAFRRMLTLIMEHDLARFSSIVRAVNVWFGLYWDSVSVKVANDTIARVARLLDDPAARAKALLGDDWEEFYFAAWSEAFENAPGVIVPMQAALKHKRVEVRYSAVYFLSLLAMPATKPLLAQALDDEDMRVADRALSNFYGYYVKTAATPELFEIFERQFKRWTSTRTPSKPVTWPWTFHTFKREELAAALIPALGQREVTRLVPYLEEMQQYQRAQTCTLLAEKGGEANAEVRALIFRLAGDGATGVRETALKALDKWTIAENEVPQLEDLLTRKSNDLRRALLTLLAKREDAATLQSASRLLASKKEPQRLAGLELLRQLSEAKRSQAQCRRLATEYKQTRRALEVDEVNQLNAILETGEEKPTLDNALGLYTPPKNKPKFEPQKKAVIYTSQAALNLYLALDALVAANAQTPVKTTLQGEYSMQPLGAVQTWAFPRRRPDVPLDRDVENFPLRELIEAAFKGRPASQRDQDGLELLRVFALRCVYIPYDAAPKQMPVGAKFPHQTNDFAGWLFALNAPENCNQFMLDAVENALTLKLVADLAGVTGEQAQKLNWQFGFARAWINASQFVKHFVPEQWTPEHERRLYALMRCYDENRPNEETRVTSIHDILEAVAIGAAPPNDLVSFLVGPRAPAQWRWTNNFHDLTVVSARKPDPKLKLSPAAAATVQRIRERILEIELKRGEQPTAATDPANALRYSGGLDVLAKVVRALGERDIKRGSRWGEDSKSREYVFSQLIRKTFPGDKDDAAAFAKALPLNEIGEERLIEVAMFAPHWAAHVEHTLGWKGLSEAIWWVHAHTKDSNWSVEQELRDVWAAQISERTPLSSQDLMEGAVDVCWHRRVIETLGDKRFAQVLEVAKLAASGTGHTRAKLFANAMRGAEKRADIVERIGKRQQDAVRALGLLPLPKNADKDVLDRYKIIQEFVRSSRQFGSQRQASEKRAASIALENLARTAGYADPQRLEWAMEAKAVADLAKGPIKLKRDEVELKLAIDAGGEPDLTVTKSGKELKDIPAALKKDEAVVELRERRTELKRQASRMRKSLEAAMVRGDTFTGAELKTLYEHPVLAPMLSRLVLVGEHSAGYPEKLGRVLRSHDGKIEPIGAKDKLRIAHPHDLFTGKKWHLWQRDCFARELVQPLKQVFRELYLLTEAEKSSEGFTRRYSGHQVQPKQALALLGGRGWIVRPEEGVSKTYHDAGITAHLGFMEGFYTPAEIEGLTVENVAFSRRGRNEPVKLKDVPPRLFSEAMRDLDLVVSVAHRGGVDPEASASSIEMRGAIIRETCELLKIGNVSLKGNFALIKGKLGDYSVHLGSAITHRMPGGMLFIVPVHAAHRGRIFLPFADEDPKAAEVLSKILLLARDHEIKDPNILDQMR